MSSEESTFADIKAQIIIIILLLLLLLLLLLYYYHNNIIIIIIISITLTIEFPKSELKLWLSNE